MYQFWLNTDDADVVDRLKVFTFLTRSQIEEYDQEVSAEPYKRAAQRRLALAVTELVHSEKEALAAEAASQALFGQGELTDLDPETLRTALGELPNFNCEIGISVVAALVESGLVESNGQARRAIAQGSVSVNKVKITDELALIDQYLPGKVAVLSRGKKSLAGLFFD